ncbi:hypothetical protein Pan14r_27170 [Crateriforma conspicua]|uniref:Uncharacterized protein n=1 Tax=Crateriforma conspicua TaxID=2527996 RepID=A0A5C5Y7E2_9PLAN|nr:hypothetical protein Mal65_41820 [Crateriforma conspicua]TWT70411.1 hypothetical protein Pan14r_27170 [Crateriforma conspicua]
MAPTINRIKKGPTNKPFTRRVDGRGSLLGHPRSQRVDVVRSNTGTPKIS